MDTSGLSTLDYSTEGSENVLREATTFNSTGVLQTTLKFTAKPPMPPAIVFVSLFCAGTGSITNALVLTVLFRARRHLDSNVHTLIINQSAMDLFASFSIIFSFIGYVAHGYNYNGNPIIDGAVCAILESIALPGVGITADIIGLMVITLERYFKVVHAIAHRKHYRKWMTKVGVALPWIGGICLVLVPTMGTTRIVNGECLRMGVWPHEAMKRVSLHVLIFCRILNFVVTH